MKNIFNNTKKLVLLLALSKVAQHVNSEYVCEPTGRLFNGGSPTIIMYSDEYATADDCRAACDNNQVSELYDVAGGSYDEATFTCNSYSWYLEAWERDGQSGTGRCRLLHMSQSQLDTYRPRQNFMNSVSCYCTDEACSNRNFQRIQTGQTCSGQGLTELNEEECRAYAASTDGVVFSGTSNDGGQFTESGCLLWAGYALYYQPNLNAEEQTCKSEVCICSIPTRSTILTFPVGTTSITRASVSSTLGNLGIAWNAVTRLVIPSTVVSIERESFSGLAELVELEFEKPASITRLEYGTFKHCPKLAAVEIPRSVNFIDDHQFSYSGSLASVTFEAPATIGRINNDAFALTALTTFTIPSSVNIMGTRVFNGCSLTELIVEKEQGWEEAHLRSIIPADATLTYTIQPPSSPSPSLRGQSPSPSPSPSPKPCKEWCIEHSKPWSTKCSWKNCLGCSQCDEASNPSPSPSPSPEPTTCADVWDTDADGHACGARIAWVMDVEKKTYVEAGQKVAGEFPDECGLCGSETETGHCSNVWDTPANEHTCGARIAWVMNVNQKTYVEARNQVAAEHPAQCRPCAEDYSETEVDACSDVWDTPAGEHPCGARITYLMSTGSTYLEAGNQVANEFPAECGPCVKESFPVFSSSSPSPSPSPSPKPCKDWCIEHSKPWSTKCSWKNCLGCSQCDEDANPSPSPSPSPEPVCQNKNYQQCGGRNFNGETCCAAGWKCDYMNEWYSQCRPDTSGSCGHNGFYSQCGGRNHRGPTCCVAGSTCKYFNEWYSQCLPN